MNTSAGGGADGQAAPGGPLPAGDAPRDGEERLRLALDAGGTGVWE